MNTWLYLYIIAGVPCLAVSVRPVDALHVQRRTYQNITGSTVIRFLTIEKHYVHVFDDVAGNSLVIYEVKGEK